MGQLLVRNVEDDLKERLKESAKENGRSLEAEVRGRLRASFGGPDPEFWRRIADRAQGHAFTQDDLDRMDAIRRAPDVIASLDQSVRAYWQRRARENGRSVEAEVVASLASEAGAPTRDEYGMGSDIAALFSGRGIGFTEDEVAEIERYRCEPLAPTFNSE